MKSKILINFLIVICLLLSLTQIALADRAEELYERAAKRYHELYSDSSFKRQEDNWLKTIKQFYFIYQKYPNHPKAPASLYNIGKLYRSLYGWNHKSVYLDRSCLTFRKLVTEYPKSSLADNAQFMLAENYEVFKKDNNLAYAEYEYLVTRFPNSQIVSRAKEKMNQLRPGGQGITVQTDVKKGINPVELTTARYGGLSEADDDPQREMVLISKVDYWSTSEWSRMVVNASDEIRYKYQVLNEDASHPQKRLYIDIFHAFIPEHFKRRISSSDGLISQARIGQFDKHTVRIVLDIVSLDRIKVFHFSLPNQYKIVVDIIGRREEGPNHAIADKDLSQKPSTPLSASGPRQTDELVSLPKAFGLKVKKIILDPGHGGRDPGAIANGMKEKDITLRLALALRKIILAQHPEIKVLMTRSTDRYVSLEARTAFANKNKGDLFISIHVNAAPKSGVMGVETYYLNLTSDNDALSLAAKENQTSMKTISDLQSILNDLLTNSKIQESSELAQDLQTSLVNATQGSQHTMRDLGVKKAPFIVLLGAQMPSVLIEVGFLTNPDECDHLRNLSYRSVLAQGIYQGVKKYID